MKQSLPTQSQPGTKSEYENRIAELEQELLETRHLAEKNLRQGETRLAVALSWISEGVIATNKAGQIVAFNKVAEALTGWKESESLGKTIELIFHVADKKKRKHLISTVSTLDKQETFESIQEEGILVSKQDKSYLISYACSPTINAKAEVDGVVLVFRDVTTRRAMEDEMHRVQKLESVGLLAGGIAHDFNNILTSVLGNLSLAMRRLKGADAISALLSDAERAVFRARDLTNQLLTFSKGGAPIKTLASAPTIIEESAEFALSGSSTKCLLSSDENLWSIEVDEGQIAQVIQNLVINADQSMEAGGTIAISAQNLEVRSTSALPLSPGRYVRVSVRDQGVGISKDNIDRVFDPYFTTKEDGYGLGLATTYSIMRKHGGHITVDSEDGVGTSFHLFLPATNKKITGRYRKVHAETNGEGRILVMDDEPTIRTVVTEILRDVGFEVEVAQDGKEAVGIYQSNLDSGTKFDAVIMDLTIPGGMGGQEATRLLKQIDPDANVIVSSGYSNDPVMSEYRNHGFAGRVIKPFGVDQLVNTVTQVIKRS